MSTIENILQIIINELIKIFNYESKTGRKGFIYFQIFYYVVLYCLSFLQLNFYAPILLFLASFSCTVRRLNDINISKNWLTAPSIIFLIFMLGLFSENEFKFISECISVYSQIYLILVIILIFPRGDTIENIKTSNKPKTLQKKLNYINLISLYRYSIFLLLIIFLSGGYYLFNTNNSCNIIKNAFDKHFANTNLKILNNETNTKEFTWHQNTIKLKNCKLWIKNIDQDRAFLLIQGKIILLDKYNAKIEEKYINEKINKLETNIVEIPCNKVKKVNLINLNIYQAKNEWDIYWDKITEKMLEKERQITTQNNN